MELVTPQDKKPWFQWSYIVTPPDKKPGFLHSAYQPWFLIQPASLSLEKHLLSDSQTPGVFPLKPLALCLKILVFLLEVTHSDDKHKNQDSHFSEIKELLFVKQETLLYYLNPWFYPDDCRPPPPVKAGRLVLNYQVCRAGLLTPTLTSPANKLPKFKYQHLSHEDPHNINILYGCLLWRQW